MNAFVASTPLVLSTAPALRPTCTTRPTVIRPSRTRATPRMQVDPQSAVSAAHVLLAENPALLVKVADAFNSLGMPSKVVEWGHPALMTVMTLTLGATAAGAGWKGRLNEDKKAGVAEKKFHGDAMTAFFVLAALGGSGGTLSVAMQGYDVWTSPHAVSAAVALGLMGANAAIARTGFAIGGEGGKGKQQGRKIHAYFGSAVVLAFLVHGALGAKILLG